MGLKSILGILLQVVGYATGNPWLMAAGAALSASAARDDIRAARQKNKRANLVNKNSNNDIIPILYGQARIGGTRVFVDTVTEGDRDKTKDLVMALVQCEGKTGPLDRLYFNDIIVWDRNNVATPGTINGRLLEDYIPETGPGCIDHPEYYTQATCEAAHPPCSDPTYTTLETCEAASETWTSLWGEDIKLNKYAGTINIEYMDGTDTQAVSSLLKTEITSPRWTDDHTLSGVTYLGIKLNANAEAYQGGVPTITSVIAGKSIPNVSQINKDDTTLSTHITIDSNPVDVLYDLLTSNYYGKNLEWDVTHENYLAGKDIDIESFKTAWTDCDGTYTINGHITPEASIFDNINEILQTFNGMLLYSSGKYHLHVRKKDEVSVESFDDYNIISDLSITTTDKKGLLNKVEFTYIDPLSKFEENTYIVENTDYQDTDEEILSVRTTMYLTSNAEELETLGQYMIERSRKGTLISFTAPHTALKLSPGEIIDMSYDMAGWDKKLFRVETISITQENTIVLTASEYVSDIQI
jgi:hypothetical protein